MKNIGVIIDNELYSDARVINECKILTEAGFNVFVLCFNYGKYERKEALYGFEVRRIKMNLKLRNILFAFNNSFEFYNIFWKYHIRRFIRENNIEVLHVHDLYLSKAAYYGTRKTDIKFTLDLHENYPAAVKGYKWMYQFPLRFLIRPKKWERLEKKYLSYPNNIVVLSETFKTYLIGKYSFLKENQFIIYPNVPDLKEFQEYKINPEIISKESDFLLFYFGVISERRGIYTVIDALGSLIKKYKNIKLLLIGPVDKIERAHFSSKINKPELKSNVIYYAWKDISLLPSYILASDICLSPIVKNDQHESGIANKVFQYMLFEKPLIVSNCRPQAEIVEGNNCGLVFEHDNPEDLANKIIKLYNNPELINIMGKNGKLAVEQKYNTEIVGKNLVNLYL